MLKYCPQANHIGSNLVRTFPAFCNKQGIWLIGKLSVDNTARLCYNFARTCFIYYCKINPNTLCLTPVLRIRDVYPGSRILIFTHPGSRIPDLGSRIPDPKTGRKERGEKNFFVKHFFVGTNFTKCKII